MISLFWKLRRVQVQGFASLFFISIEYRRILPTLNRELCFESISFLGQVKASLSMPQEVVPATEAVYLHAIPLFQEMGSW